MIPSSAGELQVFVKGKASAGAVRAILEKGFSISFVRAENIIPQNAVVASSNELTGPEFDGLMTRLEAAREARGLRTGGARKPWFPVIDYQRCTNCMQCLSFCLFEVYGASTEGKIQVQNQNNCKTDCPACSRVCPDVAIMFPKYRHSPINGDEVNADDVRREAMKVDISALLGGDIYAALRQRSAHANSRFARERDDARALEERKKCLTKLQQALDIPAEVMNALPTADAIRAKAERAGGEGQA
jgi:NAD-dependent dihydropyrimidine dehydrogenase PreA subunit